MSTKQYGKVPWGAEAVDWQERVNMPRMREERPTKMRASMKKHGFAAMFLADGSNRRYATAIHAGLLSANLPGASGYTIVFAEYPTEDTIDYCLEGNLARQSQFHCPWIKPENIRTVYTMEPSMGNEAVAHDVLPERGACPIPR